MTVDERVLAVVRQWVEKADNDLRTAAHTLTLVENCPTDTVCFHAQQCVETGKILRHSPQASALRVCRIPVATGLHGSRAPAAGVRAVPGIRRARATRDTPTTGRRRSCSASTTSSVTRRW